MSPVVVDSGPSQVADTEHAAPALRTGTGVSPDLAPEQQAETNGDIMSALDQQLAPCSADLTPEPIERTQKQLVEAFTERFNEMYSERIRELVLSGISAEALQTELEKMRSATFRALQRDSEFQALTREYEEASGQQADSKFWPRFAEQARQATTHTARPEPFAEPTTQLGAAPTHEVEVMDGLSLRYTIRSPQEPQHTFESGHIFASYESQTEHTLDVTAVYHRQDGSTINYDLSNANDRHTLSFLLTNQPGRDPEQAAELDAILKASGARAGLSFHTEGAVAQAARTYDGPADTFEDAINVDSIREIEVDGHPLTVLEFKDGTIELLTPGEAEEFLHNLVEAPSSLVPHADKIELLERLSDSYIVRFNRSTVLNPPAEVFDEYQQLLQAADISQQQQDRLMQRFAEQIAENLTITPITRTVADVRIGEAVSRKFSSEDTQDLVRRLYQCGVKDFSPAARSNFLNQLATVYGCSVVLQINQMSTVDPKKTADPAEVVKTTVELYRQQFESLSHGLEESAAGLIKPEDLVRQAVPGAPQYESFVERNHAVAYSELNAEALLHSGLLTNEADILKCFDIVNERTAIRNVGLITEVPSQLRERAFPDEQGRIHTCPHDLEQYPPPISGNPELRQQIGERYYAAYQAAYSSKHDISDVAVRDGRYVLIHGDKEAEQLITRDEAVSIITNQLHDQSLSVERRQELAQLLSQTHRLQVNGSIQQTQAVCEQYRDAVRAGFPDDLQLQRQLTGEFLDSYARRAARISAQPLTVRGIAGSPPSITLQKPATIETIIRRAYGLEPSALLRPETVQAFAARNPNLKEQCQAWENGHDTQSAALQVPAETVVSLTDTPLGSNLSVLESVWREGRQLQAQAAAAKPQSQVDTAAELCQTRQDRETAVAASHLPTAEQAVAESYAAAAQLLTERYLEPRRLRTTEQISAALTSMEGVVNEMSYESDAQREALRQGIDRLRLDLAEHGPESFVKTTALTAAFTQASIDLSGEQESELFARYRQALDSYEDMDSLYKGLECLEDVIDVSRRLDHPLDRYQTIGLMVQGENEKLSALELALRLRLRDQLQEDIAQRTTEIDQNEGGMEGALNDLGTYVKRDGTHWGIWDNTERTQRIAETIERYQKYSNAANQRREQTQSDTQLTIENDLEILRESHFVLSQQGKQQQADLILLQAVSTIPVGQWRQDNDVAKLVGEARQRLIAAGQYEQTFTPVQQRLLARDVEGALRIARENLENTNALTDLPAAQAELQLALCSLQSIQDINDKLNPLLTRFAEAQKLFEAGLEGEKKEEFVQFVQNLTADLVAMERAGDFDQMREELQSALEELDQVGWKLSEQQTQQRESMRRAVAALTELKKSEIITKMHNLTGEFGYQPDTWPKWVGQNLPVIATSVGTAVAFAAAIPSGGSSLPAAFGLMALSSAAAGTGAYLGSELGKGFVSTYDFTTRADWQLLRDKQISPGTWAWRATSSIGTSAVTSFLTCGTGRLLGNWAKGAAGTAVSQGGATGMRQAVAHAINKASTTLGAVDDAIARLTPGLQGRAGMVVRQMLQEFYEEGVEMGLTAAGTELMDEAPLVAHTLQATGFIFAVMNASQTPGVTVESDCDITTEGLFAIEGVNSIGMRFSYNGNREALKTELEKAGIHPSIDEHGTVTYDVKGTHPKTGQEYMVRHVYQPSTQLHGMRQVQAGLRAQFGRDAVSQGYGLNYDETTGQYTLNTAHPEGLPSLTDAIRAEGGLVQHRPDGTMEVTFGEQTTTIEVDSVVDNFLATEPDGVRVSGNGRFVYTQDSFTIKDLYRRQRIADLQELDTGLTDQQINQIATREAAEISAFYDRHSGRAVALDPRACATEADQVAAASMVAHEQAHSQGKDEQAAWAAQAEYLARRGYQLDLSRGYPVITKAEPGTEPEVPTAEQISQFVEGNYDTEYRSRMAAAVGMAIAGAEEVLESAHTDLESVVEDGRIDDLREIWDDELVERAASLPEKAFAGYLGARCRRAGIPPLDTQRTSALQGVIKQHADQVGFQSAARLAKGKLQDLAAKVRAETKARMQAEGRNGQVPKTTTAEVKPTQPPLQLPESRPRRFDPNAPQAMDMSAYAAARLSPTVLDRAIAEDWQVEIYTTPQATTIDKLRSEGFTHIMRYSTGMGQHTSYVAHNPETGETKLVLHAPPGSGYRTALEGMVQVYRNGEGQSINPGNMTVYRGEIDLQESFGQALDAYQVRPDTMVFGSASEVRQMSEELGLTACGTIDHEHFTAHVYRYTKDGQEHTLLAVEVSKGVFGDGAGDLTRAALDRGTNKILWVGTAGGLEPGLRVGDMVVPESTQLVDSGQIGEAQPVRNAAQDWAAGLGGANVKPEGQNGTVVAPVVEDMTLIEEAGQRGVTTLECETAQVAAAIAESGRGNVEFSYVLRVTDKPGTDQTLAERNGRIDPHYQESGLPVTEPADVMRTGLRHLIGETDPAPAATAPSTEQDSATVSVQVSGSTSVYTSQGPDGSSQRLTVSYQVDPKAQPLIDLKPTKKMVDQYVRQVLEQGPLTPERHSELVEYEHFVRETFGIRIRIKYD